MSFPIYKFILILLAAPLILVGIAGIFLPILPGWILIFAGFSMIAPKAAARFRSRMTRKFLKPLVVDLEGWKSKKLYSGITTRHLPLFIQKSDDLLDVSRQAELQKILFKKYPARHLVFLNQVHSDGIVVIEDESLFKEEGFHHFSESDGVITRIPQTALLVLSADCLSVFFKAGPWIGLAHAGWRGSQKEISKKMLRLICEKSGFPPSRVRIAFGPRIDAAFYEVGAEFSGYFPSRTTTGRIRRAVTPLQSRDGKYYFNLAAENKRQLLEAGALLRNITDAPMGTVSENRNFYSFRKEKDKAGRMISFIMLNDHRAIQKEDKI